MNTNERPELPNIVGIRKRTLDELIAYLIAKYPEIRFGISYDGDGNWSAMAYYEGVDPIIMEGQDMETILVMTVTTAFIQNQSMG